MKPVRTYPWGDQDPDCALANGWNNATNSYCEFDTNQVGSHPAGISQYGALDMAGNVSEWVNEMIGMMMAITVSHPIAVHQAQLAV